MKFRFKSLQTFLAALVAATALGLILITGSLAYFLQRGQSEAESKRSVQSLMATVRNTAAVAAYANNAEIGRDLVEGLLKNDVVFRAGIRGGERIIALAERGRDGRTLEKITEPIVSPFDTTEQVGELFVEPDANWVAEHAQRSALAMVAWMTMLIVLTAGVSTIVIRRLLSRPLVEVVGQMRKVVPGNPSRLLVAYHLEHNEVGVLINGFNHLLDDMAERLERERQLRAQVEQVQRRLAQIFESTPAGILVIDVAGRLKGANPAMATLIGMGHPALLARMGEPVLEHIFEDPDAVWELIGDATRANTPMNGDFALREELGVAARWVHGQFIVTTENATPESIDCVLYDVTERKLAEEAAVHEALHDHLTGLVNRRGSELHADRMLRDAARDNCRVAFLLIDLDGFKAINDIHGHDAGDFVLTTTSRRMGECIRSRGDVAARLGGDEFLILLDHCGDDDNLGRIANKLIEAVGAPIALDNGTTVRVGASIGIACFPEHGNRRDPILAAADSAMYAVKRRGKNGYAIAEANPRP